MKELWNERIMAHFFHSLIFSILHSWVHSEKSFIATKTQSIEVSQKIYCNESILCET